MFDQSIIKSQFMGLAGLRQNDNPAFPQLSSNLLYTGSNVLIEHPLINIENIDMCARNYAAYNYSAWAIETTYGEDTNQAIVRVTYVGKVWRSLDDANLGNQPDTSPLFWEEVNLLSLYLEDIYGSASVEVINQVFNKKKNGGQTKTVLRTTRLYDGPGNLNDRVINDGSLVGVEILLKYNQNIIAVVEKVGLQLTELQEDEDALTLYLYHSSMVEPIATIEVEHTKQVSFQWHSTASAFKLHYNNPDYEPGGIFYLMYDQNDLIGQAVKKKMNFDKRPCAGCNLGSAITTFDLYAKYFQIRSVRVSAANRNSDNDINLWNIEKTQYVPDNNFGINLELTVKCDLTNFLVQQKQVFEFAVRDMIIFKLLNAFANSTRQNHLQTKLDLLARNELQATYAGGLGFMKRLQDQIDAVNFEMADLDDTCMPCDNSVGLSFGVASLQH